MPKIVFGKIFGSKTRIFVNWWGFGEPTAEWTSKSASSSNFALDRLIQRSVRPKKFEKNDDRWKIFRNSSNMGRIGTKLCQNAFQTIPDVLFFDAKKIFPAKFSDEKFRFWQIWRGFWRATAKRTSKSSSTSNFAQDRLILRSVRPNVVKNMIVAAADGGGRV